MIWHTHYEPPVSTVNTLFQCLSLLFISCSKHLLYFTFGTFYSCSSISPSVISYSIHRARSLLGPSGVAAPEWFIVFPGLFECSQHLCEPLAPPPLWQQRGRNLTPWDITVLCNLLTSTRHCTVGLGWVLLPGFVSSSLAAGIRVWKTWACEAKGFLQKL